MVVAAVCLVLCFPHFYPNAALAFLAIFRFFNIIRKFVLTGAKKSISRAFYGYLIHTLWLTKAGPVYYVRKLTLGYHVAWAYAHTEADTSKVNDLHHGHVVMTVK